MSRKPKTVARILGTTPPPDCLPLPSPFSPSPLLSFRHPKVAFFLTRNAYEEPCGRMLPLRVAPICRATNQTRPFGTFCHPDGGLFSHRINGAGKFVTPIFSACFFYFLSPHVAPPQPKATAPAQHSPARFLVSIPRKEKCDLGVAEWDLGLGASSGRTPLRAKPHTQMEKAANLKWP